MFATPFAPLFAHYFVSRTKRLLILSDKPSPIGDGDLYEVAGKREARRIAKRENALCWNF